MNQIWALLQLFSFSDIPLGKLSLLDWMTTLLALIGLFWKEKKFFYFGAGLSLLTLLWQYPMIANHQLILVIVLIAMLFLKENLSQISRYTLVIVYSFAFLYKMNTSFFDVNMSCALMPLPESWHSLLIPIFVSAMELILAFLFLFKPAGKLTFILCLGFHFLIGLFGVWDFSATIIILAILASGQKITLTKRSLSFLGLHLLGWVTYSFGLIPLVPFYYLMTITMSLVFMNSQPEILTDQSPFKKWSFALILILVVQASGPLIGFTQHPSFAMFSNLETGASFRNSFMPIFEIGYFSESYELNGMEKKLISLRANRFGRCGQ